jgi:hypothetical protein
MSELMPEKEVRKWLSDIRHSLAWREEYENTWLRTIEYLKGNFLDADTDDEDQVCINLVRPHVNVVIPAIYAKNPDVLVYPRRISRMQDELARKRAEVTQNVLRYLMRELDIKTENKLCILDALICGHAWAKTGFGVEFEDLTEEKQNDETLVSMFLRAVGIKQEEITDEDNYLLHQKITSQKLWTVRSSPFDMIVPLLSKRSEDLRWIAQRFILPYDEVMEDPDLRTDGLEPSVSASELMRFVNRTKFKDMTMEYETNYSILYEVYDRKTKNVYVLAEDHGKALDKFESGYTMLDSKYHPFVMLRFNEINDEFYPEGDIKPAEAQMLELNDVRTQMNTHRKRYNRQHLSKPGALDPTAREQLKSGEDGSVIEVDIKYSEEPIESIVVPIRHAELPPEVYAVETRIKDDLFSILGTSDYASAASGGARTATEASIIATQSRFRVEERIDAIGKFTEQILRNLSLIAMRYLTIEDVTDMLGEDGIFWEQLFDDDDLRNEYRYEVIYGSSAPINRDVDREQFMKFYALTKDDPLYDQIKIRFELVRKFYLENPESWLNQEIARIIEQQRLEAAKSGDLLMNQLNQGQQNQGSVGRVPRNDVGRLPTGQPEGLPGDLGGEPSEPGGRGGTDLASAGV